MVMRTYIKLMLRSIKNNIARFIAILAIVCVGVAFLTGLTSSTPDMHLTLDTYYKKHNVYDINIKSTIGFTEEDLQSLRDEEYIENVTGLYVTDVILEHNQKNYVVRIYGVPFDSYKSFGLESGRLPENNSECISAVATSFDTNPPLGRTYTLSAENSDLEKLKEQYNFEQLTIVGNAVSPLYISIENQPSSIGKGSIDLILFVPYESYNMDIFTDAHINLRDAKEKNIFSKGYRNTVLSVIDKLKETEKTRSEIRVDYIKKDIIEQSKDTEQQLKDAELQLNAYITEYENKKAEYDAGYDAFSDAKKDFIEKVATRKNELDIQKPYLDTETYKRLLSELLAYEEAGNAEFNSTETELNNAKAQLDEAEAKLNEEISKLNENKAEFEKGLEDAINGIPEPIWYYLTQNENISYMSFKGNADKVNALSKVFPAFFFFVASLVALTSITRLVEEQRGLAGTLKSLGYSDFSIMLFYILYSMIASVIGCVIGVIAGSKIIPTVIINAYGIMYIMPEIQTKIWITNSLLFSSTITLCVTVSALITCVDQLREKPATLMIAKAPKPGKRVFLERIGFLWNRMSFSQKVTARNLIRYKKRFFMTIIGIAGCTALLLTGFGIKDSISDIVTKQFGEIYTYDFSVSLKAEESIGNVEYMTGSLYIHSESVKVSNGDLWENANIYIPQDTGRINDFITLRSRRSGKEISFNGNSVVLTEKMCENLKVKTGDKVKLTNVNNEEAEYIITDITENYVSSFVYLPKEQYRFSNPLSFRTVLVNISEYSNEIRDKISTALLQNENVTGLQFSRAIKESFTKTIQSIDYIVSVITGFAGALAIIVLYNLTNINISERIKELATLKVLGFHEKETAMYIYRETTVLTLIGSLAGFFVGIYLHAFVVKTAEVDAVMFGRAIYARSYLLSFLITMLFSILVNFIMLRRIRRINMVESLKAPE